MSGVHLVYADLLRWLRHPTPPPYSVGRPRYDTCSQTNIMWSLALEPGQKDGLLAAIRGNAWITHLSGWQLSPKKEAGRNIYFLDGAAELLEALRSNKNFIEYRGNNPAPKDDATHKAQDAINKLAYDNCNKAEEVLTTLKAKPDSLSDDELAELEARRYAVGYIAYMQDKRAAEKLLFTITKKDFGSPHDFSPQQVVKLLNPDSTSQEQRETMLRLRFHVLQLIDQAVTRKEGERERNFEYLLEPIFTKLDEARRREIENEEVIEDTIERVLAKRRGAGDEQSGSAALWTVRTTSGTSAVRDGPGS